MKLINIKSKHVDIELELRLRNWKDAVIWAVLVLALAAAIIWKFK